jgi:phosphoglucosamine mutase
MDRELFGTDGVRGVAGEYPLNSEGTISIGRAVGAHFAEPGQTVVIGCDTRESSAQIVADICHGLNAVGVDVVRAGVLPTPGLAYITGQNEQFVAGVMITASHNPYQYNGIKVFDAQGDKLTDETEAILNKLSIEGVEDRGEGRTTENPSLVKDYEDFLVGSAGDLNLTGLPVAVDSANGAAAGLAGRVFTALGAEVTALFDQPDGRNINEKCGATDTAALTECVSANKLAVGIALDGDADRLIMIDDRGREVKGDYLLYILAVCTGQKGVVATVMSNLGFELALRDKDIKLKRTSVGDRYVLEGLKETGYGLGGEQSGHIIIPDLLMTGDGLLAAVQVLKHVSQSGKTLAEWCDEVQLLPQALLNVPLPDKKLLDRQDIKSFIAEQQQSFGEDGRLLIRPSGTEPLVRVMVEAPDAETRAEQIAGGLKELING